MRNQAMLCGILTGCVLACGLAGAGTPAARAQAVQPQPVRPDGSGTVPVYHIDVVGRSIETANFPVLGGSTGIELRGTALLPSAEGQAKVQNGRGATSIDASFEHVNPAQRFGPEYLTYVLWAITPGGRTANLGEVQLSGTSATLHVTTTLQNFGLIVTAEPYYAVTHPSDVVVMQSYVPPGTPGEDVVRAKYRLLKRGDYRFHRPASAIPALPQSPKVPLDLYEAENAVRIARWAGAREHAGATYQRAVQQLARAKWYESHRAGKAAVATAAREAVQTAEDARILSVRR